MILVTGGMGFIGVHVVKSLLDAGEDVIVTYNNSWRVPDFWEAEVGNLLTELSDVQTALLHVLQHKRDCLAAVDLPGLAALQPQEQELLARLEACQQKRQAILAAATAEGKSIDSIGKLARSAGGAQRGKLVEQVKNSGFFTINYCSQKRKSR